ncbi:dihydroorotase [Mucilaginibacter daejeonensis]|uniref:dihydroorotase n=1 Tax=Mucilaginibacter daejeonensis TaxID=398049 RepID=UPI001D179E58|nr:dihydroorotase [Mucilaginibacter daejeonensis]UEG52533.1 dihydroorotase [Mucilaginibacter daejeonensis]
MNLLIRSATILYPGSSFYQKKADVWIVDGIVKAIAESLDADAETQVVEANGHYLSPGFVDLNCNIGEPGQETKEDLHTGLKAAAAGGFTGVALMPDIEPPVHSKTQVEYLVNKSKGDLVNVYPLGALSVDRAGKDMAEMYDMYLSGAKAFTDGNKPVKDAGLMERALLYAHGFGALIFSYPEDVAIAGKAKVNEGVTSTLLGMKGIPSLAEELQIARDLYLAEYTDSAIHFSTISTARSVQLIRDAKAKGLKVSCDVAAHHLVLTDEALLGFDSQYKVKPPLRTSSDIEALLQGLNDGTIDAIVSQHTPHEKECKEVEFEIAAFGIIGLQTALPLAIQAGLGVELIVEKLAVGPRKILKIAEPVLEEGATADLTLFDVNGSWTLDKDTNRSRSSNSPFMGQNLKGKVLLTCNNAQVFTN